METHLSKVKYLPKSAHIFVVTSLGNSVQQTKFNKTVANTISVQTL